MNNRLISIIVPVYKVENELERCVDSITNQTYNNIEIILVDDGSPDRCPQMCDEFAKNDRRIKVIHKENGGLSDARNYGLNQAKGEYILYVDSDDYIENDTCEKFMNVANENADFIAGECREINKNKITYQKHTNLVNGELYSAKEFITYSIMNNEWFAPACFNLYRKKFLIDNNLFFKKGIYFEDTEMLPRVCLAAKKIQYFQYPFYNYVIRDGSIMGTANTKKKVDDSLSIYAEWYNEFLSVSDKTLQKYLYGQLVKNYLKSCKSLSVKRWKIYGLDFKFAFKHSLNTKERLKVIIFTLLPGIYIKL